MSLAPDDPRHGTWNGYGNLGCRCRACKDANNATVKRRRDRLSAGPVPDTAHGINGYTNYHCRCDTCLEAHRASNRLNYHRHHSAEARGSRFAQECKNGHPRTGEHLYIRRDGRTMCATCNRDRARQRKAAS